MWRRVQQAGHCAVPGCTETRGLSPHHVVKRSQGGWDEEENTPPLCGPHHSAADIGRIQCVRYEHRASEPGHGVLEEWNEWRFYDTGTGEEIEGRWKG